MEFEEIMLKANFTPLEEYRGAEKPWRCTCQKCGRESSPRLRSVRERGSGCKYCSGNAVVPEEAIAEMLSKGLSPLSEFPGASKPWLSNCKECGSEVKPRLADIRMGHSGCKKCADNRGGKKRRLSSNPTRAGVAANFSEVLEVMRNANLEPIEDYEGSQTKWKSKCMKCGAIVSPRYTTIAQGGGGCMDCSRNEQIGRGKLDDKSASRIMLAKNLEPLQPYPGAMKPWKCKCLDCGNIIQPRYAHIQQGRKGCSFCATKSNADKRRLPQEEAFAVARSMGFEPL
jgi:recombinational DNA repair protein (RecF pathway)